MNYVFYFADGMNLYYYHFDLFFLFQFCYSGVTIILGLMRGELGHLWEHGTSVPIPILGRPGEA